LLGPWLAVAVTSALFAAMQAAFGWSAVVVAAGAGAVYGLGYELSESLLVPVACHVTVNVVLFVVTPALSAGIVSLALPG
jgi:membrane protease YdiL (CAAX protease family)